MSTRARATGAQRGAAAPRRARERGSFAAANTPQFGPRRRIEGATVDIGLRPLDDGCLTVIGGEVADLVTGLEDTGEYAFETDVYHSPDHDCTYELVLTRRFVQAVPGTWHVDGRELPANDVWAIGLRTVRRTFVALRR